MWVLLFLLSLLVNLRDRLKLFVIGGAFVAVSGLAYFAFMTAWLNIFLVIGFSRAAQSTLGIIALLIGLVNVNDFFAFGQGVSFAIPESVKLGIYARVRRILQAEHFTGALVSVVVLAVLVNTIELLCTAGLLAVYTQCTICLGGRTIATSASIMSHTCLTTGSCSQLPLSRSGVASYRRRRDAGLN